MFEHYVDVRTCVATIVMMLVVRSKSAQTNNFDFLVCTTTAEPTTTVATTTAEPTTTVATTLGLCGRMTNEILWCIYRINSFSSYPYEAILACTYLKVFTRIILYYRNCNIYERDVREIYFPVFNGLIYVAMLIISQMIPNPPPQPFPKTFL